MHFVLFGVHNAEVCPTSNAKTRDLLLKVVPEVPAIAERTGVTVVGGPYVNREHTTVVVVEADTAESVDRFLVETRLAQWNTMRVLPSLPLQEALQEVRDGESLF